MKIQYSVFIILTILILFVPKTPVIAQAPETIPDFQVNENYLISKAQQGSSSISADGSGNFVITWHDFRNGDVNPDIYAQRYSSNGTAVDSNFKVNVDQGNAVQGNPSIAADDSGNFIITWTDNRNDDTDIYAQRYAGDGTALGSNFKVNDDQGSENQNSPAISVDDSGDFVITWIDGRNADNDIYAQRYSSNGTAVDSNFKVNDDQGNAVQGNPSISADGSENFIITWSDERNGNWDIYAQRYSSEGVAIDSNFKVNDDLGVEYQDFPSISADGSGNFIITWGDRRNVNNRRDDIYAQRYASDGTAVGSNFKVNDDTGLIGQDKPSISSDDSGDFIIAWHDERDGRLDIYAQRYALDGTAVDSNFKVNDDQRSAYQASPSISADDSGNFIITWEDERNIISMEDIYAQRYASDGTALGSNFKVNDDLLGSANQLTPSISLDSSGNFIITWRDERNGNWDIYAQRYSKDGTPLDSNFKINDDQGSERQDYPAISTDEIGNFIITWSDERNDIGDVYAQRYSSDGTALVSNFKVNDDEGSTRQYEPSIVADGSGNFIITWSDERNDADDVYAQRYSSNGNALNSNFKVNDDIGIEQQWEPSISADNIGNFVITWTDFRIQYGEVYAYPNVYAQRYASNGTAIGNNFKVNDDQGFDWHITADISVNGSGNFVITWIDSRNNNYDIYVQQYTNDGTALRSNFKVQDDQGNAYQNFPRISLGDGGNFIITWVEGQAGEEIYAQRYASDGKTLGSNFQVTNTGKGSQKEPDVKLWNKRIYNTWQDDRAGGTGVDIWANVLDWDDPWGTSVDELYQVPVAFVLHQNYPNPFNPSTTIEFTLPKSEYVNLKVYNILGKEVATLVSNKLNSGNHTFQFDGKNLASGIYYYQLVSGDYREVKKMILLR